MPKTMKSRKSFATDVVQWQRKHGRHDLPWQNTQDPYRVWLSEIMLQQTQVSTVLGYYARFLERFPDVHALGSAHQDEVLALWSGLGYYSRARNLHKCAQQVVSEWGGAFPRTAAQLQTLAGIGPSTAAAVAAFCFQERVAILDGNVKRVLSRVRGYGKDLAVSANEKELWAHAQDMLPAHAGDMPAYTQALMDLGATLCLPRRAQCDQCPVAGQCVAQMQGQPLAYPVKSKRLVRRSEAWWLLWAQDAQGRVWLEQRPQSGVWAGLFSLPVFASAQALLEAWPQAKVLAHLPAWVHVLTHKDLHLHPVQLQVGAGQESVDRQGQWFTPTQALALGLPAPIRKLLQGA
jgi:A/G-specific adenine glycosylase